MSVGPRGSGVSPPSVVCGCGHRDWDRFTSTASSLLAAAKREIPARLADPRVNRAKGYRAWCSMALLSFAGWRGPCPGGAPAVVFQGVLVTAAVAIRV